MNRHYDTRTLAQLLDRVAARRPDATALILVTDHDDRVVSMTYEELRARAQRVAAELVDVCQPGSRALLLYPQGLEFVIALFGCQYAGVVAAPMCPPRSKRLAERLCTIARDARPSVVLTDDVASVEPLLASTPGARVICTVDAEVPSGRELASAPNVDGRALAVLQYTSGSTRDPKGVMLSHDNLLANVDGIIAKFGLGDDDDGSAVSWLPNYHDMGLIGGILAPIRIAMRCVLMSPASFVQRPLRWLSVISRYRGKISGGPNFAYNLCVDRITAEQQAGLDLGSWALAYCGAEPIHPGTLERFASVFGSAGFRATSFYPCYGLAESTLMSSGGAGPGKPVVMAFERAALEQQRVAPADPGDPGARQLVACGGPLLDHQIAIIDPDTLSAVAPSRIGEIWLSGPSVAGGYFERGEETAQTFHARRSDADDGPHLRTGDLGFLHDGRLYVAGRINDLIIVRGANYYPQDIEGAVEHCTPGLAADACAAFAIGGGTAGDEQVVVIQEIARHALRGFDAEATLDRIVGALVEDGFPEPVEVVLVAPFSLPRTTSGKIQRYLCKQQYLTGELKRVARRRLDEVVAAEPTAATDEREIEQWLIGKIASRRGIPPARVDVQRPFASYGLDSLAAVALAGELAAWLGHAVPPTVAYDHPSIAALTAHLSGRARAPSRAVVGADAIAIVGMACRLPGAPDVASFWAMLREGRDAIRELPEGRRRLTADGRDEPVPPEPALRIGGFLDDIDRFDAQVFGISAREAACMDPQQRLLLEVTWGALENAGIAPERLSGTETGVFVGISNADYGFLQLQGSPSPYAGTGSALSIAANRLSYVFNLRGPSMAVDTACSSSLTAVHLACQSLLRGECETAIAGGANVVLSTSLTRTLHLAGMLAADGRCKTFEDDADGYARGEGAGVVVLKRLASALGDGDRVLAVIRGSAMGQDGRSYGLTAPNGAAQQDVIQRALRAAGTAPRDIGYVEAHGSGTRLGDPIEVGALIAVLGDGRPGEQACAIGSVKSNIGHLEAAAGIAGLIKTALVLGHGEIPPQPRFKALNRHLALAGTPFVIPTSLRTWPGAGSPRRAGVSGFGFGGTNVHVVMEEPPPTGVDAAVAPRREHPLVLSAADGASLIELARRYAGYLAGSERSLDDICVSAATERAHLANRLGVVAGSRGEIVEALEALTAGRVAHGVIVERPGGLRARDLGFLFDGEDHGWAGMGRELYETEIVFRDAIDRCEAILGDRLGRLLAPVNGHAGAEPGALDAVAIFAIDHALGALLGAFGVKPAAVLGTGAGEYAAACAAGVLRLEDAIQLVAAHAGLAPWPAAGNVDRGVDLGAARAPSAIFLSSITGEPASGERIVTRDWSRRLAVGHGASAGIEAALRDGHRTLVRMRSTPRLAGGLGERGEGGTWLELLREGAPERAAFLRGVVELHVRGLPVRWDALRRGPRTPTPDLPGYPFQRQRHWALDGAAEARPTSLYEQPAATRPRLPIRRISSASDAPDAPRFEVQLDHAHLWYLRDHAIQGAPVVPGSVWIEAALEAADQAFGAGERTVEDVEFHEALSLAGGAPVRAEVILSGRDERETFVRVRSRAGRADRSGAWIVHATARLRPAHEEPA